MTGSTTVDFTGSAGHRGANFYLEPWNEVLTLALTVAKPYAFYVFPDGFSAHWVRFTASVDGNYTAYLESKAVRNQIAEQTEPRRQRFTRVPQQPIGQTWTPSPVAPATQITPGWTRCAPASPAPLRSSSSARPSGGC